MSELREPIWDGVYHKFSEASLKGEGFSGTTWIDKSLNRAKQDLENYKIYNSIPPLQRRPCALSVLVASACALNSSAGLRILDFGGGLGLMYLIVSHETCFQPLDYHIVDN